jgi:hypothetical protein
MSDTVLAGKVAVVTGADMLVDGGYTAIRFSPPSIAPPLAAEDC